jgi:ABC-type nitrate/sulfonate/bicarbonate transport system permease component
VTVARAHGAGPGAGFVKVILPAMTGTLLAGLRAGLEARARTWTA